MLDRAKPLHRTIAIALMAAPVLVSSSAAIGAGKSTTHPLLATPDQVAAEALIRSLGDDPEVKALQETIKADLAKAPIGQTADGARRIDEAVGQWTRSLAFKEAIAHRPTPAILWGTDDTPRTWLGYTLGGVGTSGDNPDFVYRSSALDGSGRYEITGQFDPKSRPAQFVLSVSRGAAVSAQHRNKADLGNLVSLLTDRDLKLTPDGRFRVTFGAPAEGDSPNHIALEPGEITVGFRDCLTDWTQRPTKLEVRRLDTADVTPFDPADVRKRVLANLPGYVQFWSHFPEQWFGGLQPNSIAQPVPREGGWGYLAGVRFQLKPDEAVLVTTSRGGAAYTGIQVVDPWMIASSAKQHQTSLNLSQAKPNKDGTFSYVIAPSDPGIANWLDTAGLHDGFAILRWQVLPEGTKAETLLRDFKVIKLSEAAKLPGIALATPADRKREIARRADEYASRTH